MSYSHDNTVLIWDESPEVLKMVNKICTSLKLSLFEVVNPTDILAVPCFFAVIDGEKLNKETLDNMAEVIKYENPKEFAVLLTKPTASKIPASIKTYFIDPIEVVEYEWIKSKLFSKRFAVMRHKKNKRSYDKTVFRVVFIIKKLLKKNSILYLDDLCREFNVSDKTIKRDFELLRSMGEDIVYDRNRKGYILEFSTLDTLIE